MTFSDSNATGPQQRERPAPSAIGPEGRPNAALEQLAAAFDAQLYEARVVEPPGRLPCVQVRNRQAPQLSEYTYAQRGWCWWSWAGRIAPLAEVRSAAATIARVLRTSSE